MKTGRAAWRLYRVRCAPCVPHTFALLCCLFSECCFVIFVCRFLARFFWCCFLLLRCLFFFLFFFFAVFHLLCKHKLTAHNKQFQGLFFQEQSNDISFCRFNEWWLVQLGRTLYMWFGIALIVAKKCAICIPRYKL